MSPGVVADDIVAKVRASDGVERLALKVDKRDRERKAGNLQALLPHLEAKVGVLEISDEEFFVEASDGVVDLPSHQHACGCHSLPSREAFCRRRPWQSRSRM